jgi:hypothetical protein
VDGVRRCRLACFGERLALGIFRLWLRIWEILVGHSKQSKLICSEASIAG